MNDAIFFFFYNLAPTSVFFNGVIIFFAEIFPYIVVILAALFLLFHHEVFKAENPFKVFWQKKKEILFVFFSGCLAWFVALILKILIHAERPFLVFSEVIPLFSETGYAFPSGHATFFMALAISLFLLHKKAGYVFIFFAFLIGIARIIAGVHFPVDILSGFILGAVVSFISRSFYSSTSR